MNRRPASPRRVASIPCVSSLLALGIVAGLCAQPAVVRAADECTDGQNIGFDQPLDPVVVAGEPVYDRADVGKTDMPALDIGLCGAFRFAGMAPPFANQPGSPRLQPNVVPDSINAFMDGSTGMQRVDKNLVTPFDLSNSIDDMGENSYGDYVTTAQCKPPLPPNLASWPGCGFPGSDGANLRLGFGTRHRGFLNVKPEWIGKELHFGFYTDDILGVRVFWRVPKSDPPRYEFGWVISRGTGPGTPKFITTNQVVFSKPGLYPIELVHGSYSGAAVLEFGILLQEPRAMPRIGYNDRELPPLAVGGRVPLDDPRCRFDTTRTAPDMFFQSVCGRFRYKDGEPGSCGQCPDAYRDRQRAPGEVYPTYPCIEGRFCNSAAVCSPCVEDRHCGPRCFACGKDGRPPRCKADPEDPCNADKATCCQCVSTKDCSAGQICDGCNCVSPPCCTGYFPVFPDKAKDPNFRLCSPCLSDADCQMKGLGTICDLKNARCTNTAPPTCVKDGLSVDEQCGPACNINCKTQTPDRPYCLNNQVCVACRRDADCPSGNFCLSGTCSNPCVDDRHCGASCQNCGVAVTMDPQNPTAEGKPTNKPYCKVDTINGQKVVATGACVQCREDKECATGQTCVDNRCTPDLPCSPACPTNEVCFGGKCVQCFTDAQCPCGHCIEGRCTDKCSSNQDCEGNQCCQKSTGLCVSGRCGGSAGGALCGCSMPGAGVSGASLLSSDPALPEPFEPGEPVANRSRSVALAAFAALLLGLAMRRRVRLSTSSTTRWS